MKRLRLPWRFLVASLFLTTSAWAQEQGDGTLHVLRPLVHAEQEEGEICLEFDHDLETADHHRAASNLHLESAGKNLNIASRNISVDGNLLCLSGLDHRREYRFSVGGMKGAKGEKMAGSYSLAFTVPDRQPSLAFTSETNTGLMRWQDKDPLLHVMNVPQVRLELYHITDPEMVVEAWRQRRQASLAPSESATFAHDHGQLVWSSSLELVGDPDKTLEQKISLHDAVPDVTPGLYLIVARAPENKKETDVLAPTSALWLLRSNLKLHVFQDKEGFYTLAEKVDGSEIEKDSHLIIEDANGQKLTEGKSDENGVSFLPLAGDKKNAAASLTGLTASGDIDFTDLTQEGHLALSTGGDASLKTDKPFYLPTDPVTVVLTGHDQAGRPLADSNASLQLTWSDGNPYASFPAVPDKKGTAHLSLAAPATDGNWLLIWKSGDGKTLAQEMLRVTSNAEAPRLEASTDRDLLPSTGDLDLTLKSETVDGKPFPYLAGRMFIAWAAPDQIFQDWRDYHFGTGQHPAGDASALSSFITDEKGIASLHLSLMPPDDGALFHTAFLRVHSEDSEGATDPAPLTLPVKPKDDIIGVKPLASGARFPENSLARFSVIVLDPEGHRKGIDDLAYQVYEEGRSFEWRQEEGRWGYKQLRQNRRLGGAPLAVDANRESIIEWPVTAGSYRLEIIDSNGTLRTSLNFSSGWSGGETKPNISSLDLKSSTSTLSPEQKAEIKFSLAAPSMIGAFIGDDHIRKIIHQPYGKGEGTIGFVAEKDWGSPVTVHVEAYEAGLVGQISLPFRQEEQKAAEAPVEQAKPPEDFSADLQLPSALRMGDVLHAVLDLKNNGKTALAYRLITPSAGGIKISDVKEGAFTLPPGQERKVAFTLIAQRAGMGGFKLDVLPPHANESREWQIPILPEDPKLTLALQQKVEPNQSWPTPADKPHLKTTNNILFLSPAPLLNAPLLLVDLLRTQPFTTVEIADVSEVLRAWQEPLIESGLQTKNSLDARKDALLLRLMARQKSDGGFPVLPGGVSDFNSTAQALVALAHAETPTAKPALELAAGWLKHRLENTWFDEKERPLRAVAYQALAEAGKLDVSSLHYFSDTSADKSLPPLAAAQLALAFAKSGDQSAASFWLDVSGVRKSQTNVSADVLYLLAANPFFGAQEVTPLIEKAANKMKEPTAARIEATSDFLLAAWSAQQRLNPWRITVNSDKRTPKDVLVIPASEKGPLILHNTADTPIFLVGLAPATTASPAHPLVRYVYQLNGTEVEARAPLDKNQTYLVVLEGPWFGKDSSVTEIHDNPFLGLQPVACLPREPAANSSLTWLKGQNLDLQASCEIWRNGIDMLEKKEGKDTDSWRTAYLAKTLWSGNFVLGPAQARNMDGNTESVEGTKTRVDIR